MEKQILLLHRFAHRRNTDASFDSICLGCFLTVGSALVDAALKDLESVHRCKMGSGRLSQPIWADSPLSTPKEINHTISSSCH